VTENVSNRFNSMRGETKVRSSTKQSVNDNKDGKAKNVGSLKSTDFREYEKLLSSSR